MKNLRTFSGKLFFTIFLLTISTACTRKSNDDGTKVSMSFNQFSKVQSLGGISIPHGFFPAHLIANVHFDGKTAFYEWDCKEMESSSSGDPSSCSFPSQIDFNGRTFPNGNNRTIQVLIVFANEFEQMIFGYDDEIGVVFNGGNVYVDIGDNWSVEGGGKPASLAGRHESLKSGHIEGYYQPKRTGRPKMKLFDEYMFSGWFKFMFFEGVKLTYIHTAQLTGAKTPIFVEKSLEDIDPLLTSDSAAVKINVPNFYRVHTEGESNFKSEKGEAESIVLGFFSSNGTPAPNGSQFSIQLPTEDTPAPYAYRKFSGNTLLDPIDNYGQYVDPTNGTSGGTESAWLGYQLNFQALTINADDDSLFVQSAGLTATDSIACETTSDENLVTNKCIKIKPEYVRDHKIVPFEGPFEVIDGTYGPQILQHVDDTSLAWRFLPGVAGTAVHGLAFFIVDQDVEYRDITPCHDMALKSGISGVANLPMSSPNLPTVYYAATKAVGLTDVEGSIDLANTNSLNGKKALVCPWFEINSKKFFSTYSADNHGFHSGSQPQTIAQGNFNNGFSGDGIVTESNTAGAANSQDSANAIAIDSSGRKVVVGYSKNSSGNKDAVVWRYLPNGSLDTSFGTNGVAKFNDLTQSAPGTPDEEFHDVAIDSSGNIIVTGQSTNASYQEDLVVLKLNPNGALDTAFDTDGILKIDWGFGNDIGYAVKVNSSDQIFVTGEADTGGGNGADMVVFALEPNGSYISNFNTGSPFINHGVLAGGIESGSDLEILSNGDIIVVGSAYSGSYDKAVVWKLKADGTLDTGFDSDGKYIVTCTTNCKAAALTIDSNNDILMTGFEYGVYDNMSVWKLKADGSGLDTNFAAGGKYTDVALSSGLGNSYGFDIALDEEENIVIAGRSYNNSGGGDRAVIWRLDPQGALDTDFASSGLFHSESYCGGSPTDDTAYGLVIDGDGRIFVVGDSNFSIDRSSFVISIE
ncbi:MAG: hypothetical protein KDD58_00325 [Bdellovibrionales bacterium]|nr:hypothetical protein [Bdellovibrionales bacterium]